MVFLVALIAALYLEERIEQWRFRWTVHTVDRMMKNAPVKTRKKSATK